MQCKNLLDGNFSIFESTIWLAVGPIPCSLKNDDQYRYQDHQQVVKVEFKRRLKPLKVDVLIDQGYPLFRGASEARRSR
jgi:hypothetical protein